MRRHPKVSHLSPHDGPVARSARVETVRFSLCRAFGGRDRALRRFQLRRIRTARRAELESLLNGSPVSCGRRGTVSRTATIFYVMQTIEITDPLEARRCRYAQYRGERVRLMLNGLPVTGMIRSVKEDKSSTPARWTVTVVPKQDIAA